MTPALKAGLAIGGAIIAVSIFKGGWAIDRASGKIRVPRGRPFQSAQPLSVTRAEEVQSIPEWAKARAVPAD